LPVAAVRPDYELIPMNGSRLLTPGFERPAPTGDICAVSYRAELRPSPWEVLSHLVDPQASVVARSRLTGGRSVDEFEDAGLDDSKWSLESSTAAAAALLGEPVRELGRGASIEALREDTAGLYCGDVIIAVDGRTVETAVHLRAALAGLDRAELTVLRESDGDQPGGLLKVLAARRPDGAWGIRVVTADRVLRHGVDARFTSEPPTPMVAVERRTARSCRCCRAGSDGPGSERDGLRLHRRPAGCQRHRGRHRDG